MDLHLMKMMMHLMNMRLHLLNMKLHLVNMSMHLVCRRSPKVNLTLPGYTLPPSVLHCPDIPSLTESHLARDISSLNESYLARDISSLSESYLARIYPPSLNLTLPGYILLQ